MVKQAEIVAYRLKNVKKVAKRQNLHKKIRGLEKTFVKIVAKIGGTRYNVSITSWRSVSALCNIYVR